MSKSKKKRYGMPEDEFLKLKAAWDQKLADSGLVDIEYQMNGEPAHFMRGPNPMDFIRAGGKRIADATAYYEAARAWRWYLRETGETPRDEIRVWDMHAEGKSFADICQELDIGRGVVQRIIREQKAAMRHAMRELLPPFGGE